MIAYRAVLDVPSELVARLAGLLRRGRRRGTRRHTRVLGCRRQALLGLVWFPAPPASSVRCTEPRRRSACLP